MSNKVDIELADNYGSANYGPNILDYILDPTDKIPAPPLVDVAPEHAMRFNSGKAQLSYLLTAPEAVAGVCRVFEHGATKYARGNWKKGLPVSALLDSMLRHTLKYVAGQDIDEDCPITGQKGSYLPHVDHILWNALVLAEMFHTRPDMDDREGM